MSGEAKSPALTARVEAVVDGTVRTSQAIPFTLAGVTITAHIRPRPDGGRALGVSTSPPPSAGSARFEKTCPEAVTFTLFDGDTPIHQSELNSMFEGTTVELVGPSEG
ncbi:MAG: hypothetical protein KA105_04275 [Caulobacter sp.]|jgi:hypothetical protein|nr:hypothetical protein [Caulobacter sp.]